MANDLSIRIKINSDTKALEITQDGFEKIRKKAETATDPVNKLTDRIAGMGHAAVGLYTIHQAFDAVVLSGIRLNSQFEQMKLGIASLIAVNSSNVTAMGKNVTAAEKFIMAQHQAAESVELLRKANLQTPATLAQVTEGYQAALAPALRLGLTTKQTVEYVKNMTMAAAAMGQPMEQIAQESRALLSGEIDMNAQVARNLQITNQQIKMHTKQGDLYEFLTKKLGDFAAGGEAMSQSWEGISSNIVDSIETIKKKATESLFDNLKQDGLDLQKKLTDNADAIAEVFARGFTDIYLVAESATDNIGLAFTIAFDAINALPPAFALIFSHSIDDMNGKYRELGFFDYMALGTIVAIEGLRQIGDVGLSVITFLGKMMNTFAEVTLGAFAGINNGLGKLADLTGVGGEQFYANAAYWNKQVNTVKENGLKIDQAQNKIIGDMSNGLTRLTDSYNKLALKKTVAAQSSSKDHLVSNPQAAVGPTKEEIAAAAKAAKEKADMIQALNDEGFKFAQENIAKQEALEKKATEDTLKRWEDSKSALLEYYSAMGDTASAFEITESDRMQKLAESGILSNEQMLAVLAKDNEKFQKEQRDKDNQFWLDLFSDFEKAMGEQIFDAMTDKWQSFGDWLKDFWSSITTSIARAASSQLSQGIIGSVKDMAGLGESGSASSNIVGTFKTLLAGGAFAGSAMYGATTDSAGFTTTVGGTVIDAAGQITKAGTDGLGDVGTIINTASTLKTAYSVLTSGLSQSIADAFASGAASIYNLTGSSALAGGIGNFGAGFASPWAMSGAGGYAGAGAMLGGAAIGGIGGYALGSLGDMLFGANTKAGSYGAIGGAIGSLAGPIGAIAGATLGSLIGGMFGSTKEVDRGLYFQNDTTSMSGLNSIQSYRDTETKSWFSGSGNSDYNDITDSQKRSIEGIFKSYDYLLTQLGSTKNIVLKASRYTAETFQDEIAKGFLATYMGIEQHASEYLYSRNGVVFTKYNDTEEMTKIYNMWSEYAKSVDKTVMQALTDSVNSYIQSTRDFTVWGLERSGNTTEALSQKAQWLQDDFANLESMMGVTGVTVENFTKLYEDAVKNSLDPTTISQWQSLGTALRSATDAQDAYAKSLEDTAVNGFNQLSSAYSTFAKGITETQGYIDQLNGSVMTFADAGDDPAKIMQAYQAQADAITQISSTRISALQKELDYSKSLYKAANNLRYTAMSGTAKFEYTNSMLDRYIADAITKVSSGKDISSEVSSITDLAGNYADLAMGYYGSQSEYNAAVSKMANKIESLGGRGTQSTLSDVEAAINMENDSLTSALSSLKDEAKDRLQNIIDSYSVGQSLITDQMQSLLDGYVTYWGENSPIVQTLRSMMSGMLNQSGSQIDTAYQSALGRGADSAGSAYWSNQVATGAVAAGSLGMAIGAAGAVNGEISRADYVTQLYTKGLNLDPSNPSDASRINDGVKYWVNQSNVPTELLASTFQSLDPNFHSFAVGTTNVPYDMFAQIHEGEGIIPETFMDGVRKGDVTIGKNASSDSMVVELKALREDNKALLSVVTKMTAEVIRLRQEISRTNESGTALNVKVIA